MKIDLTGKTAVVTGSTEGIGWACAAGLAEAGAAVILNGRGGSKLDRALEALQAKAPSASLRAVAADLGTAEGCAALAAAVPQTDILVNNVGIFGPSPFSISRTRSGSASSRSTLCRACGCRAHTCRA